jgi:hypothetical protein
MTETNKSPATAQPSTTGRPGDVPPERPSQLAALDALPGEWDVQASFAAGFFGPDSPATTVGGGRTSFEWLAGQHFLIQRFTVENPTVPSGIAIIGAGDEPATLTQHYYDSRGVARVFSLLRNSDRLGRAARCPFADRALGPSTRSVAWEEWELVRIPNGRTPVGV